MGKIIRLTERDLTRLVQRVINEQREQDMDVCEKAMKRMKVYYDFNDFYFGESHGVGGVGFKSKKTGKHIFSMWVMVDRRGISTSVWAPDDSPDLAKTITDLFYKEFQNAGKRGPNYPYSDEFTYKCSEVEKFMASLVSFEKVLETKLGLVKY